MIFLIISLLFTASLRAQTNDSDFTVIALPDTQFYSESYPQIFNSQTQWIVNNAATLNIQFVLGLGDLVNVGSNLTQWQRADAAVKTLDAATPAIPYLLAIGNRDYQTLNATTRKAANFNTYFGPNRYAAKSWYRGNYNGSNENFYGVVSVNGRQFLLLMLEFYPRDAVLTWADQVVNSNSDKEVIVVTHSFTYTNNSRIDRCEDGVYTTYGNDGDAMWNKFVRKHSNIIMVLNGHKSYTGRRVDLGDAGNLVNQILSDYQSDTNGGNGYLRILRFRPSLNQISVQTYSPYLNLYKTDSANQFVLNYHATSATVMTGAVAGKVRVDKIGSTKDCVAVSSVTLQAPFGTKVTSSSGTYSFANVASGDYVMNASRVDWQTQNNPVRINGGYTASLDLFVKPNMGAIAGKVTSSSGAAVSGAKVAIAGGMVNFSKSVTTGTSGTFSFPSISIGSYTVTVSKTGFTTQTATTAVTNNATSTVNVTLQ